MVAKARSTQKLVNAFPSWSAVRQDEQSLGFQLMNTIAKELDSLRKQMKIIGDNYHISTANISDIDIYYSFKLPQSFSFSAPNTDFTSLGFLFPSVSGLVNDTWYDILGVTANNIKSFWYETVPTRLTVEDYSTISPLVASGFVYQSPLDLLIDSGLVHYPNRLSVKVEGGSTFLSINDNLVSERGIVQITGENRQGREITEEVYFIHDETILTRNEFSYVAPSGIRVYGIKEYNEAFLTVQSADFNADDRKINYELDTTTEKEDLFLFWKVGTSVSGLSTLDLVKYDTDSLDLRLGGFVSKHTFLQQELKDASGLTYNALDVCVQPNSDFLWIADDNNRLHVYKSDLPYFDMSNITSKNYDAISIIEVDNYYKVLYDEVTVDYVWLKPTTGMVAHRVWVEKPDGNKYSIEDGVEVTYHTDESSWIYGEPHSRQIRGTDIFTLDQYGQYIYSLEVEYTDGTVSIDQRIVLVSAVQALATYLLYDTIEGVEIEGIDFDSEHHLWVMSASGVSYKLDFHYDVMIADPRRKVLYFREPYDLVRVFEDE